MKKLPTLLFTLLIASSLFGQIDIDAIQEKEVGNNLGKCFVSYPLDTNHRKTYYLQVIPAEYETVEVKIDETFVKKHISQERLNNPSKLYLPANSAYSKIKLMKKDIRCMSMIAYRTGKSFCFVEIPSRYVEIERVPVIEGGDTTYTIKEKTVKVQQMVKSPEIKVFKSKRKINPDYPVYETIGGKWSEWEEVLCSLDLEKLEIQITDIQRALIKLGYDLEVNGILARKDKDALIDFQKKNNLVEGILDMHVIEALGLLPEKY